MTINIGTIDRVARGVLGLVLLYLAFFSGAAAFQSGLWMWLALAGGVIMLGTSAVKFCPLYRIFGVRTCQPMG